MNKLKHYKSFEVVEFPLITEKAVNVIELENKVSFIVKKDASKIQIKKAVEELYNVKVKSVNTVLDRKGRKKAIVKLAKDFKAADLATKLGVL